jgi:PAS domain-containing protein
MESFKLFAVIKKIIKASKNETNLLIIGGLTAFFFIFILNTVFGIYSIYGISNNLIRNMTEINMARNAQVTLHEQILAWDKILIYGDNYADFQKNYHEFSIKAEIVQNILFNLKLQSSNDMDLIADIDKLIIKHKERTSEFTDHIVHLDNENFNNYHEKVVVTKGRENELIDSITNFAEKIETESEDQSLRVSNRSMIFSLVSSVFLITLLIYYGRRIGAKLIKTNNLLEERVKDRTKEYIEANESLQKEIDEHKITEQKLIQSGTEIEKKNMLLSVSEKKYRLIVEGTKEIIFTLDEEWRFKSINDAAKALLQIEPEDTEMRVFTDFVYDDIADPNMRHKVIISKLEESKKDLSPIRFDTFLKTQNLVEPVGFKINIEFFEVDGYIEVLGKAVKKADDRFSEFFISEKCEYLIGNLLFTADDISYRITGNLQKYLGRNTINLIRLGLLEMIINSIEHGNLGITFKEKSQAMMEDEYFDLLSDRQKHPDCRDKKVKIEYIITSSKAVYKITDDGAGFDHIKTMEDRVKEANDNLLPHGRGIAIAKNIFDEVRYNNKGNQVLLVKYFD